MLQCNKSTRHNTKVEAHGQFGQVGQWSTWKSQRHNTQVEAHGQDEIDLCDQKLCFTPWGLTEARDPDSV